MPTEITDLIKRFPDAEWDWSELTDRVDINTEFIIKHKNFKWDWMKATKLVPFEFILKNLSFGWNWEWLSENIELDDILSHVKLPWDWSVVSQHDDLTWDVVKDNPNLKWDFKVLSTFQCGGGPTLADQMEEDDEIDSEEVEIEDDDE